MSFYIINANAPPVKQNKKHIVYKYLLKYAQLVYNLIIDAIC